MDETTSLLGKKEKADESSSNKDTSGPKYDSVVKTVAEVPSTAVLESPLLMNEDPDFSGSGSSSNDEAGNGPKASRRRHEMQVEQPLADSVGSLEGFVSRITPDVGCAVPLGIWLLCWRFFSSFTIQFPLHCVLLAWPLSIGYMGFMYVQRCPVNPSLPSIMMATASFGILSIFIRILFLMCMQFKFDYPYQCLRNVTKLFEAHFFLFLIIQFIVFYQRDPVFVPGDTQYCDRTFYNFTFTSNKVSVYLMAIRIFVCLTKRLRFMRRHYPSD